MVSFTVFVNLLNLALRHFFFSFETLKWDESLYLAHVLS